MSVAILSDAQVMWPDGAWRMRTSLLDLLPASILLAYECSLPELVLGLRTTIQVWRCSETDRLLFFLNKYPTYFGKGFEVDKKCSDIRSQCSVLWAAPSLQTGWYKFRLSNTEMIMRHPLAEMIHSIVLVFETAEILSMHAHICQFFSMIGKNRGTCSVT